MTQKITGKIVGFEVHTTAAPDASKPVPQKLDQSDVDRRIRLKRLPTTVTGSMRSPKRPQTPNGCDGRLYYLKTGNYRFAVFISHLENGRKHVFEVWVNGAEQPRGLGAIAKVLSADLRQTDKRWIFHKLDILAKTKGDPCDIEFPNTGLVKFPSIVSAFAALVRFRLEELGYRRDEETAAPVMDALYFLKEPKAGPNGSTSVTTDVFNPGTGDDFVVGLKEMDLPADAGLPYRRIPYSVWLAGDYPRTLDGLCKLLSKDMHVCDPAWIAVKLDALRDYKEPHAEFMAWIPGQEKQRLFPSTEAYLAAIIMHRYQMLGILDADGQPVKQMGLLDMPENVVALHRPPATTAPVMSGETCKTCGMPAVVKRDGCSECTNCGERGDCG